MFSNERYITRGAQAIVPFDTQLLLWELIEELGCQIELDYLQVFKLQSINQNGQTLQSIEHHQEKPQYMQKRFFRVSEPVDITVWIIDDGYHLLQISPQEY